LIPLPLFTAGKLCGAGDKASGKPVKSPPTLGEDDWPNAHSVYRHGNFSAVMQDNGNLLVQPFEDGKKVEMSLEFG